jgi:two-component system NtrC family sensor kinase
MRIRSKTILFFLLLSILPLVVMGWMAYENAGRALKRNLGSHLHHIAHNTIYNIDQTFYYLFKDMTGWADLEMMQEVLTDDLDGRISGFFTELSKKEWDFAGFMVLSEAGEIVASDHPEGVGKNPRTQTAFQGAMQGRSYMSGVVFCQRHNQYEIDFAVPIRATFDRNKIIGVLRMNWRAGNLLRMTRMEEMGASQEGYQNIHIAVLQKDGLIIAGPKEWEPYLYKNSLIREGFQSATLASRGVEGFILERSKRWGDLLIGYDYSKGFRDFAGFGWHVLAFMDAQEAFASTERLRYIIFTMGSLVIIFVIAFALVATQKITGPLIELTRGAQKVAGGDFTTRIDIHADEEVLHLAGAFNQMTENLHRTTVSRDYVDNILNSMINSLVVLTPEGKILTVNQATCDLLGYRQEELLGRPFDRLLTEEEILKGEGAHFLIDQKAGYYAERVYRTKSEMPVPVFFSSSVMSGKNDNVLGVICVAQDISDRKKAEAEHARLATALQSVGDAILITDVNAVIQYVNPAYENMTGYGGHEIIGKTPGILKSGKQTADFYKTMWDTLKRGKIWSGALINRRKEGTLFDAEMTISIVRDSSFKIINYVAVLRDVTERKKAEIEQARLAIALKSVWECITITDINGIIQYVNPAFEKMTGYSASEVMGGKPGILRSGIHDEAFYKALWETILSGKIWTATIVNRKKDGSLFTAEQIIAPVMNASQEIINFVGVLHDLTKRKEMEDDLRRVNENLTKEQRAVRALFEDLQKAHKDLADREKALRGMFADLQNAHEDLKQAQRQLVQSEKLASIGQLAAGVAHEINNPLGFVSSNLQTLEEYIRRYTRLMEVAENLKKSVQGKDWQKAGEAAEAADQMAKEANLGFVTQDVEVLLKESKDGIERIKKIILDLRTFAREDEDVREVVNIERIMDNILNIVGNEIRYKADLVKEYGDVPVIRCNSRKIGQVFVNLLINAAQAIEQKGIIRIKTYSEDKCVCVEVSDTGKGMDAQTLQKIFDPFFTTKPVGEGTGLGLSISYDIIKEHEGDIIVQSEVGKGTTFKIVLPADAVPV